LGEYTESFSLIRTRLKYKLFDIKLKSTFLRIVKGGSFYKKALHGIKQVSSKISTHSRSLSNVMHSYI